MKKAILTFGLFSLVVLTSFTTTETKTKNVIAKVTIETGDTGGSGQSIGGDKKTIDAGRGQGSGSNKKLNNIADSDTGGNGQSIGGNKKTTI